MPLSFRLATPADAAQCNEFQEKFLKRTRTIDQWRWEFGNRTEKSPVLYALAEDAGEIVGSQALIRVPMVGLRKKFETAKGEDALVHPRYWGKDLLRPLWDLLLAKADAEGVSLVWGFNARRPVFEKLGFHYLEGRELDLMVRPLRADGLQRLALYTPDGNRKPSRRTASWRHQLASSLPAGIAALAGTTLRSNVGRIGRRLAGASRTRIEEISASPAIEKLTERFISNREVVSVRRSPEFLRWRLIQNPWAASRILGAFNDESLVGYAGYAVGSAGFGMITDLVVSAEGNPEMEFAASFDLIARCTEQMAKSGARVAKLPIFKGQPGSQSTSDAARQLGYFAIHADIGACVRSVSDSSLPAHLLRGTCWHFTNINTEGREG